MASLVQEEVACYDLKGGLRYVPPYHHIHKVFAKKRWLGMSLLNMYLSEFRSLPEQYYRLAIEHGLIKVNDMKVGIDYKIQESDLIEHLMHRHEPPVQAQPIEIIAINDDVVAVNKPASLHVHPCGGFTFNTVQRILAHEQPQHIGHAFNSTSTIAKSTFLLPVHRLDRLVSGVLLFARNAMSARLVTEEFKNGCVGKVYIARVSGSFPCSSTEARKVLTMLEAEPCTISEVDNEMPKSDEAVVDILKINKMIEDAIDRLCRKEGGISDCSSVVSSTPFIVSSPLKLNDKRRDGKHQCSHDGKESHTLVQLISVSHISDDSVTNQVQSLVVCHPITGRTHQIRLHLERLGFPIQNDPLYGPSQSTSLSTTPLVETVSADGHEEPTRMSMETSSQSLSMRSSPLEHAAQYSTSITTLMQQGTPLTNIADTTDATNILVEKRQKVESVLQTQNKQPPFKYKVKSEESALLDLCVCCQCGDAAAFSEEQLRVEGIYLHAYSYTTEKWCFTTSPPSWVSPFFHLEL